MHYKQGQCEDTQAAKRRTCKKTKTKLQRRPCRSVTKESLEKSDIGGDLSDYTSNYVINDHTIKYAAFARDSVSSDTISAAELTSKSKNTLQGSTRIRNDAFEDVRIDALVGFGSDFLPDDFSTFISLAGGVDRVTGSRFADVIIGPDLSRLHGTMTFNSGDGGDFV